MFVDSADEEYHNTENISKDQRPYDEIGQTREHMFLFGKYRLLSTSVNDRPV